MSAGEELSQKKYVYNEKPEYNKREILRMEKEMTGLYISGHPLESIREEIKNKTNINSLQMNSFKESGEINIANGTVNTSNNKISDGMNVKYIGIISHIKKLYTKRNTEMAFMQTEDLYGIAEIVIFDSCFRKAKDILVEDNIVMIEGKISIKGDENVSIIANEIKEFGKDRFLEKTLKINITNLTRAEKDNLKIFIRSFKNEKNNMKIEIIDCENKIPCGAIFTTEEILEKLKTLVKEENIEIT